jgi:peroxiredoxin
MAVPPLRDNQAPRRLPLSIGDIAPACVLPDSHGSLVDLRGDAIAGNVIVILFCPRYTAVVTQVLDDYRTRLRELGSAGPRFFCIMRTRSQGLAGRDIPFPVLCDVDGKVFRTFDGDARDHLTTIVLRPNHHVAAIVRSGPKVHAADALAAVERLAAERKAISMALHPPVLMVPEVLTPEECLRLIEVYETRGKAFVPPGPGIDYIGTDYKMRIPEYGRRDRVDHWIVEDDTKTFLRSRLQNRLFPEVAKAFHYNITAWERMRIGCYEGERGGELHGHRDNVEPTPYRRFAMSMNLNVEEFSGGELRFPEFGDQRYRPDNGTAFVFSSALLHEALHVTSGRRLVLLAFLFGDR